MVGAVISFFTEKLVNINKDIKSNFVIGRSKNYGANKSIIYKWWNYG